VSGAAPSAGSGRESLPPGWPEDLGPSDLVLLGHPVAHSRSPAMHTAALATMGLDLRYRALDVPPAALDQALGLLDDAGIRGANVTVPHKLAVMPACDRLTDEARLVGAVNTLTWDRDGVRVLEGHNTDAVGLGRALAEDFGTLAGARAVLVGTGGAARAAAVALTRAGARVSIAGRRAEAAAELADLVARLGGPTDVVDLADDELLAGRVAKARLVVNATTLGLHGEHLPAACETLGAGQGAYDLIYGDETPFLAAARAGGAAAHGGLGMLVHQAAASLERWTGRPAPVAVLRGAAERA
jgi:shikimate dehydrogenase